MKEVFSSGEKRRHKRVVTCIPFRYRWEQGGPLMAAESVTWDMSPGGFRFRTAERLRRDCNLALELDLPGLEEPVSVLSRVAWTKEVLHGGCDVGGQFVRVSRLDEERIAKYLRGVSPC